MKIKSKAFIVTLLSALMVLATIFGFGSLKQEKAGFNGIYAGEFTTFAEEETQGEVGVVQGMLSTDGAYLLLATPLTITDFSAYSAVGYEITKDGEAFVADGLESNAYYTGITVNTANGTITWTMADIFGESATGMIVAEIEYSAKSDYSVKPYAVKDDNKVYGAEQAIKSNIYSFSAIDAFGTEVGSTTATQKTEKGYTFYGSTMNKSFATNVYVENDVDVSFVVTLGSNKLMNAERVVGTSLTVNGKSDGVALSKESVSFDGNAGWTAWQDLKVATLSLKAGNNAISWTMVNDVNLYEIAFISDVPVTFAQEETYTILAIDAFAEGVGTTTATKKTQNGHTFYNNSMNATFVTNVSVPTATTVTFLVSWTCNVYMTGERVAGTDFTVNGSKEGIVLSTEQVGFIDWYTWQDVTVATIKLSAGNNVISFSPQKNINLLSLKFKSFVPVTLTAPQTYTFGAQQAFANGVGSAGGAKYNSSNGGHYGSTTGKTFTTNVYVEQATSVTFLISWGSNVFMTPAKAMGTTLTVNGVDGIVLSTVGVASAGWTTWQDLTIATIDLQAGNNVISWTMQYDVNLAGISFVSLVPVSLGVTK